MHRREVCADQRLGANSAGTLCDADGELFIKPCTQSEINFYQSTEEDGNREFAELMPVYMGTLQLSDPEIVSLDDDIVGLISENGDVKTTREQITASIAEQVAKAPAAPAAAPAHDGVSWVPSKGKKIKTDKAVVLENASYGYEKANILDVKLGVRLWADDAPLEKKRRFDTISQQTTHGKLGFRIAGMRVFHGSDDASDWDDEGYKIYDKDYGRVSVNNDNVVSAFRKFMFNKDAGVDKNLGRAVCAAFIRDLKRVEDIMSRHETRMYSTSLLFVYEGDGKALRAAIDRNNEMVEEMAASRLQHCKAATERTNKRMDSGIVLDDDEYDQPNGYDDSDSEEEAFLPIYSLKLIDFAHAQWTPGQGPDENILTGVRSLRHIFEQMVAEC